MNNNFNLFGSLQWATAYDFTTIRRLAYLLGHEFAYPRQTKLGMIKTK